MMSACYDSSRLHVKHDPQPKYMACSPINCMAANSCARMTKQSPSSGARAASPSVPSGGESTCDTATADRLVQRCVLGTQETHSMSKLQLQLSAHPEHADDGMDVMRIAPPGHPVGNDRGSAHECCPSCDQHHAKPVVTVQPPL
jgi:hypothetical protein